MKHQSIYNRLRRIEGSIRGIEEMVAKDKPEREILIQLSAAKSSLSSTIIALIEEMAGPHSAEIKKEDFDIVLKFLK